MAMYSKGRAIDMEMRCGMFRWKRGWSARVVAALVTAALLGGAGVSAAHASPVRVAATVNDGDSVTVDGVKSWLVKQALRTVAAQVRNGRFYRLADPFLDTAAEAAMRRSAPKIADVIDDVANLTDIATHRVRSEVYKRLAASLGHGTANVVAGAVEGVLWILL